MQRFIFIFSFIAIPFLGKAQERFTITYKSKRVKYEKNVTYSLSPFEMVINDSVSYTYNPGVMKAKKRATKAPLGSFFLSKSTFVDIKNCYTLSPGGHQKKVDEQYLIIDSCTTGTWEITDSTKPILGYQCYFAIGRSKEDTFYVWFTPDLPKGAMPYTPTTLPGTVLEYWLQDSEFISTAKEIKAEAVDIIEPNYCQRITRKEYVKWRESITYRYIYF